MAPIPLVRQRLPQLLPQVVQCLAGAGQKGVRIPSPSLGGQGGDGHGITLGQISTEISGEDSPQNHSGRLELGGVGIIHGEAALSGKSDRTVQGWNMVCFGQFFR